MSFYSVKNKDVFALLFLFKCLKDDTHLYICTNIHLFFFTVKMNTGLLFRSVYQAVDAIVPKILALHPFQNVLAHKIHHMCDRQRLNLTANNPLNHNTSVLLQSITPMHNSICGLKTRGILQLRCKDCYYVSRRERLYVMCKSFPRHKQVQMKKREYKTWILTWASTSKVRGW